MNKETPEATLERISNVEEYIERRVYLDETAHLLLICKQYHTERLKIEAPTDKEILKAFPKLDPTQSYANTQNRGIRYGAKWMRKILTEKQS